MSSNSVPIPFSQTDPVMNTINPPKPKKPKDPKPAPAASDPEVEAARRKQLDAERRRRGSRSTILTSPLGDVTPPNLERKSLLGA